MKPDSESTATVIPLGPALRVSSDARLARLAAKGNRAAFAAIFDRYHQDLYRYCVSLLHNQEDAADALQSTMLHALRAVEGDDRDIALRPWLYRIAHNESVSLLRRRSSSELTPYAVSLGAVDVEGNAAMRARVHTLLEDIRSLPERQRASLVMRELAGLGYDEIAAALVTSPAGAKQAVYDARRALLDLARGRDETCESIQLRISAGDRRVTRARAVRAHLSACATCRLFQAQIAERESALAGLAPVLPAAVAAHALKGALVGAGGTSAEGVLFGVGTAVVAKAAATVAVTVALGAGVNLVEGGDARGNGASGGSPAGVTAPAGTTAGAAGPRGAHERPAGAGRAAEGPAARSGARDGQSGAGQERDGRTRRGEEASSGEASVDQDTATVSAPGGAGTPSSQRRGRLGIRRPGGSSGDSGEPGPIRTGLVELRDTVTGTVDGVRETVPVVPSVDEVRGTVTGTVDSLPIRTPSLPRVGGRR